MLKASFGLIYHKKAFITFTDFYSQTRNTKDSSTKNVSHDSVQESISDGTDDSKISELSEDDNTTYKMTTLTNTPTPSPEQLYDITPSPTSTPTPSPTPVPTPKPSKYDYAFSMALWDGAHWYYLFDEDKHKFISFYTYDPYVYTYGTYKGSFSGWDDITITDKGIKNTRTGENIKFNKENQSKYKINYVGSGFTIKLEGGGRSKPFFSVDVEEAERVRRDGS